MSTVRKFTGCKFNLKFFVLMKLLATRPGHPKMMAKSLVIMLACCLALNAQANPIGAQVVNGAAAINQSGNTLTVTNSPNAIINWQGFSINQNETTHFIQQSAASSVLNRVVGSDPSQLLGALTSNGKVFLINPSGILVGQGARIDVAGLVASTLNISNTDFFAGKLNFSPLTLAGEGQGERVVNAGHITTPEGGTVYLIAPQVENSGLITTPKGETILAAGNTVQLIDTATPGVTVQVTGRDNNATNLGQILADSGRIGVVGAVVRNSGTLSANSLVSEGGRIFLKASQRIEAGGTISAQGTGGGEIKILADMQTGTVNVTGELDASAPNNGNGGFIETSGAHVKISDSAKIDTSAPKGKTGNWLIDPVVDFTIAPAGDITGTALGTLLGSNSITIQTTTGTNSATNLYGSTGTNGDIFVNDSIAKTSGADATLTLQAHNNIVVSGGVSISSTSNKLNVVLNSDSDALNGGNIQMKTGSSIVSNGGNITLGGGADPLVNPAVGTGAGPAPGADGINLVGATLNSGAGNISLIGTGAPGTTLGMGIAASGGTLISASGGTIMLDGTAGAGTIDNRGLYMQDTGTIIQSSNGDISIVGTGAAGITSIGIMIADGPKIISTGTAKINLVGTSVGGGAGINMGVYLSDYTAPGTAIQSASGNISITGTASGTGPYGYGIWLNNGAKVVTNGSAAIKFDGTGASGLPGVFTGIDSSGGNTTSTTNIIGGPSATGPISLTALTNDISLSTVTIQTSGPVNLIAQNNVILNGAASIATLGGNVSLDSNSSGTGTGNIQMFAGSSITTNSGNVVMGGGANPLTGYTQGSGGSPESASGIYIAGDITAGAGNVTMRGEGANNNLADGITFAGGTLSSNGIVTIDGIAHGYSTGVTPPNEFAAGVDFLGAGTRLTTQTGTVTVTGLNTAPNADPAFYRADGIMVETGTILETTGSGTLTFNGTANSFNTSWGIGVLGGTIQTTAAGGGALTMNGTNASGLLDGGVVVLNGNVLSNSGEIRMVGQGLGGSVGIVGASTVGGANSGNILLQALDAGSIDINGGTSINAGTSTLTISALGGGAVNTDSIAAGALRLLGSGTFNFTNASNNVGILAANVAGGVMYRDTNGFAIGSATSFDGATNSTTAGLTATYASLTANGTITQTGVITAGNLFTNSVGGTTLNGANVVGNLSAFNAGSGNIAFNNVGSLTLFSGCDCLEGVYNPVGSVTVKTTGDMALNTIISSGASGNAVVLVAGGAFNTNDNDITLTGSGRWLVYSADPANDWLWPLDGSYAFQQYNAPYGTAVLGSGNGLLYSLAPPLTVSLIGTVSKVYDGTTIATLTASNYSGAAVSIPNSITGLNDNLVLSSAGSGQYDTPNVGTGKTVTASGFTLSALDANSKYVYYMPAPIFAAIGDITPLPVIVTPPASNAIVLSGSKVYDGTPTFSTGQMSISNIVSGDVVSLSAGTANTADQNVGINKPFVSFNGLALTGASAANYTLAGISGFGTITPRLVTFTVDPGQGKTYGQFDPTYISFNDNAGALQVVAGDILNGVLTRVAGENAGVYPIGQGSLTSANNPNYDITFVSDVFTINPALLQVVANHQTKVFGAADPPQSIVLNGLIQNPDLGIDDVAAAQAGTLMSGTLSREAGEAVGGGSTNGEYAFKLGTLSAGGNYTINSFISNTLAITQPLTSILDPLITAPPGTFGILLFGSVDAFPLPPPPPPPLGPAGGDDDGTLNGFGGPGNGTGDNHNENTKPGAC